ncbi:hypothetical protein DFO70_11763 [Cytobacillus firmus]|uniref:Uncharacterized protein n=2 Tax=Cytobacillus TaxID=2675230 RepID=A0A366JLL1_CYTFI|nr:hypothetical protein DFO70_11763 [Cytobacillus firmus]TDX39235.1 hypothetical protein DFO72_11165 [Cytobacillus oceanisediminis]
MVAASLDLPIDKNLGYLLSHRIPIFLFINRRKNNFFIFFSTIIISQTSQQAEKAIIDRFIQLRAKGFHFSPVDEMAAKEILAGGVSLKDALIYLKECFDDYKPKHSRDQINSLSYCVGPILDRHHQQLESQKLAQNVKPFKSNNSYQPKGKRSKPIRTEMLADWFDESNQPTLDKPPKTEDDLARKKAELNEKLKKLRSGS